jgi:hypothetical protein
MVDIDAVRPGGRDPGAACGSEHTQRRRSGKKPSAIQVVLLDG